MNPAASTAPTSSLHLRVVGGARNIGSCIVKHPLRRGCDVDTFDTLSANCRSCTLGDKYMLPGNLAHRVAPLASPLLDKHRRADRKIAYP